MLTFPKSCPTCSTDMTVYGCSVERMPLHHCPVCGTLRTCDGNVCVPDIVRRCRELALLVPGGTLYEQDWERVNLNAALYPKEENGCSSPPASPPPG